MKKFSIIALVLLVLVSPIALAGTQSFIRYTSNGNVNEQTFVAGYTEKVSDCGFHTTNKEYPAKWYNCNVQSALREEILMLKKYGRIDRDGITVKNEINRFLTSNDGIKSMTILYENSKLNKGDISYSQLKANGFKGLSSDFRRQSTINLLNKIL